MKGRLYVLLLLLALLVWALNDFSGDIGKVYAAIVGAYAIIQSFFNTAKAMEDGLSKDPSEPSAKKWFESSKPGPGQIARPAALSPEKAKALEKIRSRAAPVQRAHVEQNLRIMLGRSYHRFWEQVDANEILSSLARNGFWLEGLALVFEQNKNSFPQNNGRVLAQVLIQQWTPAKIGIAKATSLEVLQARLGELVRRRYPDTRYPNDYGWGIRRFQPYTDYEEIVLELGEPLARRPSIFGTYILQPLLKLRYQDPNTFFQQLYALRPPWRQIVLLPFYFVMDPLSFLKDLLLFPFTWLERTLGRYATDYRPGSSFWGGVNSFWDETYLPFKKRLWRFVDLFNVSRQIKLRRAKKLIDCATRAGILGLGDEHIWFTEAYWCDYFKATTLLSEEAFDYFLRRQSSYYENWQERGEPAAIMACGLCKDAEKSVEQVLHYSPISASKCLLTLEDLPDEVQSRLRAKILEQLVHGIQHVQHDGNSGFCLRSFRALRSLSDNPYYAHVALEKIPHIYDHDFHPAAAKLVASFGPPAFDMLMQKARTHDAHLLRMMLVALAELRDRRAIPFLREQLEGAKDVRVRVLASVVLAACFQDEAAIPVLRKFLRFEFPEAREQYAWFDLGIIGEEAVSFGLQVMVQSAERPADRRQADPWPQMKEQCLKILDRNFQDHAAVEAMLLDVLECSEQPRLTQFAIEALGTVKSKKASPVLTRFLADEDDYVRGLAANALHGLKDTTTCSELTGLLYAADLNLVTRAISALSALKCVEAMPALIGKLDSEDIEKYYDTDPGYPIALHAAQGLMSMGTQIDEEQPANEARQAAAEDCMNAAAAWFNAHLGDQRPIRHNRTLAYESRWQLYILKADNQNAGEYYSAWVKEHPDDSI